MFFLYFCAFLKNPMRLCKVLLNNNITIRASDVPRNASDTVQEKATAREGPATPKNKQATAREGPATAAERRGDTQNQTGDTPKKQATAA
jgi:hypothetical protein